MRFDFKQCSHGRAEWRDFVSLLQKKKPAKRRVQEPATGRHPPKAFKFKNPTEGVTEIVANTLSEAKAGLKRSVLDNYRWYYRVLD